MVDSSSPHEQPPVRSRVRLFVTLGLLGFLLSLFLFGRYTGFINLDGLQNAMGEFAEGPWGVPALILTFCGCAFIGVPQFVLIGIAVFAFGPLWGAVWSWVATLCSGTITFWLGRFFGQGTLQRLGEGRIKRFTNFIARNAFLASVIVRNAPAGPFIIVNMAFGAVRAPYLHYAGGMALGILPKIAVIAFGMQSIEAILSGNILLAVIAGLACLAFLIGGVLYVRYRRRKGEDIALSAD
ncbi:MAG: VTT domain-containing protein [Pseudomonadota bacterium]